MDYYHGGDSVFYIRAYLTNLLNVLGVAAIVIGLIAAMYIFNESPSGDPLVLFYVVSLIIGSTISGLFLLSISRIIEILEGIRNQNEKA